MIKTAMIIEDCKSTLEMTKFLLMKLGIKTIITISNKNEFKNFINQYVIPDLIITDWNIEKDFKGHHVISAMEALGTPIAVVSSEDVRNLTNNDKCSWFKKPLTSGQLSSWMQTLYVSKLER